MTVGVDQVAGVAGFLNPGNMVDVVLTVSPPGSNQSVSKIVLQNLPLLAIGQIVEQKEGKPVVVPPQGFGTYVMEQILFSDNSEM